MSNLISGKWGCERMNDMIGKFLNLAGKRKKQLYFAWFFQALTSICEGAIYFTLFLALKDILNNSFTKESLLRYSFTFLLYTVLHFFFYYLTIAKQRPVSYAMMRDERLSIAAKIKQFPLYYFTKDKISQLTSLFTTDLSFVEMNIMEIISGFVSSMVMTVIFALMLIIVDWRMALLLIAGFIPGYILYQQFQKNMIWCGENKKNTQVAMIDSILEYVQGMEAIKAYQLEHSGESVEKQVDEYCSASDQYESTLTNWNMAYKICLNIGLLLSMGVGITLIQSGSLTPATYLFFAIMGIIFYRPLEALMGSFAMMNLANASLDNISEIHNLSFENEKHGSKPFTDVQSNVQFEDVSFSYDGKRKALNHVSFTAKPGTITALVGPSGSGKTTLCNLIARFWDIDAGKIMIGDMDIRKFKLDSLMKNISMVFQDVFLFADSIENNIKFGCPEATREQVLEAAKKACCHDFIMTLPDGYNTVIGEGGGTLSGGEKQRISIARAILKDAPIIILDETTSNIDPENEDEIQRAIEALTYNKTIIMIAHRLKTVKNASQILVLNNGHIIQQGKHNDLIKEHGLYAEFVSAKQKAIGWKII